MGSSCWGHPDSSAESYEGLVKICRKIKGDAPARKEALPLGDRKLAERKLREWLDDWEREELSPAQPINFGELLKQIGSFRTIMGGSRTENFRLEISCRHSRSSRIRSVVL